MRTDTHRKYGIIVSEPNKPQEKSPTRRSVYLRPNNKDEANRRVLGAGFGKARAWHKFADSKIKTNNMKNMKTENRIIKHNLEKSKELISEEVSARPVELHNSQTGICQVDGIPVQFGSKDTQLSINLTQEEGLRSPEFVGQDIVYHVFYQDNPLDIIESLLVAKDSHNRGEKQEFACEGQDQTVEKVDSEVLHEEVEGDGQDTQDVSKPYVEETPRRNTFRANWNRIPSLLMKQERKIRSLAFTRAGTKVSNIGNPGIIEDITSPQAENMEQDLLQLLNARLQLLSSQKLKYLLGVMDKLDRECVHTQPVEELPACKGCTVSMRILSTWDDQKCIGLVEVDLFDTEGKKINVLPNQISLNHEDVDMSTIGRLIDGVVKTSDGSHAWEIPLPSSGLPPLEISFWLTEEVTVGHLEVWNHCSKGVKDVQVLVNGEFVWQGSVSKFTNNACTRISLLDDSTPEDSENRKDVDESVLATNLQETTEKRSENESLWSMAAHYFEEDIGDEDIEDLKAETEKFDDRNMELEEIERFINSEESTYEPSNEQGTYEIFRSESTDEATILEALNCANQAISPELEELPEILPPPDGFCIPMLPRGSKLTVEILSTWGDPHYVGLSGIEIFDECGQMVHINPRKHIQGNFTSSSLFSGLYCGPCPVERLVDGVNVTCDDSHMWLAPFTSGHTCTITFSLEKHVVLGMVRFWNYNKSALYSHRGVRLVRMLLDSQPIFYGEIRRASGSISDACKNAEPILFTENEETLSCIEFYDMQNYKEILKTDEIIDGGGEDSFLDPSIFNLPVPTSQRISSERSRAFSGVIESDRVILERSTVEKPPFGSVLRLNLLRSWGDCYYFGLTGIQARTLLPGITCSS